MEIDVFEEKEIDFDFLKQPIAKAKSEEWISSETLVVLIKAKNQISADFSLCGKSLLDWVKLATAGCAQKVIDQPSEEDFLEKVRALSDGFEYVAVFFSDTPLLKNSTFVEIMDFFACKNMNVIKLSRGFVFRADFLQNATMILSSVCEDFGDEDFFLVNNAESASAAFDILNQRILDYHKQNGVVMFGESTIFVEADVEIEEGTIIFSNNTLRGQTYVGKNVILESGNTILNTIICDGAKIGQSFLENSKIGENKTIGPFAHITNQKI